MTKLQQSAVVGAIFIGAMAWANGGIATELMFSSIPNAEQSAPLQAVSAPNGKWSFDLGDLSNPTNPVFRAGGTFTLPLGERFGVQGDLTIANSGAGLIYGGALHGFMRDPALYLVGVTGGFVRSPTATLGTFGPEVELYFDRFSFEGWGGVAALNYDNPATPDKAGAFFIGDIAYYPTDDWRLSLGVSSVLGYNQLHAGSEYLFRDWGTPLSLTADARLGQDGVFVGTVGIRGYLGGNSATKSLIGRHREDDPANSAIDLYTAAGDQLLQRTSTKAGETPPAEDDTTPPSEEEEEVLPPEDDTPETPVDPTPTDEETCLAYSTLEQRDWTWASGSGVCTPVEAVP